MPVHRSRRPAFTLVELIVVIAIIALLAALTAAFFPNFQDTELVNRGADQLQNWLLSAKMQAKRDGLPTGIRMTVDVIDQTQLPAIVPLSPSPNPREQLVTQLSYIQQPNSFAQGAYTGFTTPASGSPMTANLLLPNATSFTSMATETQGGDYLEVNGGGVPHLIKNIAPIPPPLPAPDAQGRYTLNITLDPNTAPLPVIVPPTATSSNPAGMTNYRIIPQARLLAGEQSLQLPSKIAVSFAVSFSPYTSTVTLSQSVPLVKNIFVPDPSKPGSQVLSQQVFEIMFAPSGAVVGQGTGTGQIILWVRNISEPLTPTDLLVGKGTLIVVQPRTGFIAAHPVASTASPYAFTTDGRSSGL